ncbi:hypothetical protein LguiA_007923 [Lonicera macranthoides]
MAVKTSKANKKIAYDKKLCQLLDEYNQILVAAADNNIRKGLRGDSTVLPGPQYSSEAALLAKLGIRPFSYGLVVLTGLRGTAGGDGESAAQEKDASGEIPCVCERRDKELQTRSHLRSS